MEKFKTNILSILFGIIGMASWLFPNVTNIQKTAIMLACFLVSLATYSYVLYRQNSALSEKINNITAAYDEVKRKHTALAVQFSEKQEIIKSYEHTQLLVASLLNVALTNKKEARIQQATDSIHTLFNNMDKGGSVDEH